MPELFSRSNLMGTFKGFSEKGFEFAAEIVAPYSTEMQDRPQLGQFLLIQLGTPEEASLGRITKFVPSGLLASPEGEDYVNTMQERDQDVPEDLKKSKLKYRVQIKLLGAVKIVNSKVLFVPSQRRLPHLGAKVALPSEEVLKELCQLSGGETDLGDYVLGEFVFSGKPSDTENIMRHISPPLKVTFNINHLVSKRTVVFARAGYGKSNLIKFLIAELYRGGVPKTEKGQHVGTLIFDADGEYFWPDFKKRPGLCDVDQMKDNIVVFTNRETKSTYYNSWKAGNVKVDIRDLPARDVIGLAISSERQEHQNVIKLKSITQAHWKELVNLIKVQGLQASDDQIGPLLGYSSPDQIRNSMAEIAAARSNMFNVVQLLHDPDSKLISGAMECLRKGYCVIVDISMLSSVAGFNMAGLLMRKIFNYNQETFTGGVPPIPVITIIEEAQSVLGKYLDESSPFVEWVKEGRKYDLGAILVTQQPGSMAPELLSQADNWFSFHLLSEGDAGTLGKYNSHFSPDVLSHLIGEPIIGNCYVWSAPLQPFVLPVRIRNFETLYKANGEAQSGEYLNSPARKLAQAFEAKNKAFADELRKKLQAQSSKSYYTFPDDLKGIYDGALYMLIKQIKEMPEFNEEFRSENDLKAIILPIALNSPITIIKGDRDGQLKDFHCAPTIKWQLALQ